jgi:hypothetical protein
MMPEAVKRRRALTENAGAFVGFDPPDHVTRLTVAV